MEKALTELTDMRAREGANLKKDLEKRISFLKERENSFYPGRMMRPGPMRKG